MTYHARIILGANLKVVGESSESIFTGTNDARLTLSSMAGLIAVGDVAAGGAMVLKTKLLIKPNVGKTLIEIVVYCQDDFNDQFIPQGARFWITLLKTIFHVTHDMTGFI